LMNVSLHDLYNECCSEEYRFLFQRRNIVLLRQPKIETKIIA